MMIALQKHGAIKGLLLGTYRLLRCNPFSKGGVDDVPDEFFKKTVNNTERE